MGKMGNGIKGSGTMAKNTISLGAFTELEHDTVGEVIVTVGGKQSIEIEGDDNILPLLKTTVEGSTLKLESKENINPTKLTYRITVPTLTAVELNGVGDVNVKGVTGAKFAAELNGVGKLFLAGEVETLEAELNGVGGLEAFDLSAKKGSVKVNGVGGADINVSDELTARCNGVGGIHYKGTPKLDAQADGIGKVEKSN